MRQAIVALAWLVYVPIWADAPSVSLYVSAQRSDTVLRLATPPFALVEETLFLTLPAGTSTLVFSWTSAKVNPDSITLAAADEAITAFGPIFPADRPTQAKWNLVSPRAMETRLTIRYLTAGLTWQPEYTLMLHAATDTASLTGVAVLTNDSGGEFSNARVDVGLPTAPSIDLRQGISVRLPYVSVPAAPYRLIHVFDPTAGPDTSLRLELTNPRQEGAILWPEGRMRVFEDHTGEQLLIGEVRLPATPIGGKAEMTLSTAREVSVERRVLRIADVDVKTDVHGRLALYNREEEVAFFIESSKNEHALLKIVETIDGEWEMLSNSHEFERKDANHIEFMVPVAPHSKCSVRYRVRRLNILP